MMQQGNPLKELEASVAEALAPLGLIGTRVEDAELHQETARFMQGLTDTRIRSIPTSLEIEFTVRAGVTRMPFVKLAPHPAPDDETVSDWTPVGWTADGGHRVYARAIADGRIALYSEGELHDGGVPLEQRSLTRYASDDGDDVLLLEKDCA